MKEIKIMADTELKSVLVVGGRAYDVPKDVADCFRELALVVQDLTRCLEAHITDDAIRLELPPETVCPCKMDELVKARALLQRLGYGKDRRVQLP